MEKEKKLFSDGIFGTLLFTLLLMLSSSIVVAPLAGFASQMLVSRPEEGTVLLYFSSIIYWAVTALFMFLIRRDRPLFRCIAPGCGGNTFLFLLAGIALGFLLNGVCILSAVLHSDIVLYFSGGSLLLFLAAFAAVAVQSGAEEYIVRVYVYQRLARRYASPLVPIAVSSLIFAFLHIFNPGMTPVSFLCITLTGVLFALFIHYFNSFYLAMMTHTMWNYSQTILFGLPNSGNVTPFSVFRLDAAKAVDSFFYSVNFGIEGSAMALIVLVIAIATTILIGRAKNNRDCADEKTVLL